MAGCGPRPICGRAPNSGSGCRPIPRKCHDRRAAVCLRHRRRRLGPRLHRGSSSLRGRRRGVVRLDPGVPRGRSPGRTRLHCARRAAARAERPGVPAHAEPIERPSSDHLHQRPRRHPDVGQGDEIRRHRVPDQAAGRAGAARCGADRDRARSRPAGGGQGRGRTAGALRFLDAAGARRLCAGYHGPPEQADRRAGRHERDDGEGSSQPDHAQDAGEVGRRSGADGRRARRFRAKVARRLNQSTPKPKH